jgi:hypothetical protein
LPSHPSSESSWAARERHPIEAVELGRREQPQRVPPLTPRVADALVRVQDYEADAGAREVIADGETGLPAADHDHVEMRASRRGRLVDVWARATTSMSAAPSSISPRPVPSFPYRSS